MGGNALLLCFAVQFQQFLTGVQMSEVIEIPGDFIEMIVGNGMLSGAVEPANSSDEPVKGIKQNLL